MVDKELIADLREKRDYAERSVDWVNYRYFAGLWMSDILEALEAAWEALEPFARTTNCQCQRTPDGCIILTVPLCKWCAATAALEKRYGDGG